MSESGSTRMPVMTVTQRRFAFVMLLIMTLGSGCSRSPDAPSGHVRNRPLRIGFPFQFKSLSPLANDGFYGAALNALVYGYLLRTQPDGHLKPDLALVAPSLANGGISRDGRTITYHLRHGVRWQDGAPLTASDVAFTYRAVMNPANLIGSRFPYTRVTSVRASGPWTVVVRLPAPDSAIVGTLFTPDSNVGILPEHLLGRAREINDVPFDAAPIGSGPYRVTRWERGSLLRLAASPVYYGGKPAIETIELHFVTDTTTIIDEMRTGELDAQLGADEALVDQYARLPNRVISNVPYLGADFLAFNMERPLVRDVRVRRAIASAIDREALARDVYHVPLGSGDPGRGLFSYADDPHAPWPRFDPRASSVELDAAGWRLGHDGFRHRDGATLALESIFANGSTADRIRAVTIQRQLANVGVRLDLTAVPFTQFWLQSADGGRISSGNFDVALGSYSSNVDPDVSWLLACRERAPNGFNQSRYCNRAVDAALTNASRELDPTRRVKSLRRAIDTVAMDVPFLPLRQVHEIDVLPRDLRGYQVNGTLPYDSVARWAWAP